MLGGVVVAGTVAAGTTAFTAAGLDATSATTTIGGQVDIQTGDIDGLTLDSVAATWDTATPAKITQQIARKGAGKPSPGEGPDRFISCKTRTRKFAESAEAGRKPGTANATKPAGQVGFETGGNDPMRSMNLIQLTAGVAVAGVVAAGSTALTGSGVTWGGSNGATATRVIGGALVQAVSGVSVTNVTYGNDATGTHTDSIAVTVTSTSTKTLTLTPAGGTWAGSPLPTGWQCTDGTTTVYGTTAPAIALPSGSVVVTCVPATDVSTPTTNTGWYSGLTGLTLAVTGA